MTGPASCRLHWLRALLGLLLAALLLAGCSMTPERARAKLAGKKIAFSAEALRTAIQRCDPETVGLLLAAGMDPNQLPASSPGRPAPEDNLRVALRTGNREIIRALLARGADVNCRSYLGETPLFSALIKDDPEVVKLLLDHGADLHAVSNYGQEAAVTAVHIGRLEVLKLFLARGVAVNAEDSAGKTLLFHAAGGSHPAVTKLLLDEGADLNRGDRAGVTPLMQAITMNRPENFRLLLAHGAEVHSRDLRETSALMCAAGNNRLDMMQALLDKGAAAEIGALTRAATVGHADAVRLLLEKNRAELVPFAAEALLLAASNGNTAVVQTLLDYGVPVDATDAYGETALVKAIRRGHAGTAHVLRERGARMGADR